MQSLVPKDHQLRQPVKTVFDPQTGYVVVQLHKEAYGYQEVAVRYLGRVFQPKTELHITIVSADAAETVRGTEKDMGLPTHTIFDQLVQGPVRPQAILPEQAEPGTRAAQP